MTTVSHPMLMLFMFWNGLTLWISGSGDSERQGELIQFGPCCLCPSFPHFMNCFEDSQTKTLFALNTLKWKWWMHYPYNRPSSYLQRKYFHWKDEVSLHSSDASDHCSFCFALLCLDPKSFPAPPGFAAELWVSDIFTEAPSPLARPLSFLEFSLPLILETTHPCCSHDEPSNMSSVKSIFVEHPHRNL